MVPESFSFQLISILPPRNPSPDQQKEGLRRVNEALKAAKVTKSYQEFGILAEKVSEDDFRVNMGDHKTVEKGQASPGSSEGFAEYETRANKRCHSSGTGIHDHSFECPHTVEGTAV